MNLLHADALSWVGRSHVFEPYVVTSVDIAKYCHTLGFVDPVHFDVDAARARGHRNIVAPPGYHMVIRHSMPNVIPVTDLAEDGGSPDMTPPSSATRRMAGETVIAFLGDIVVGDEVVMTKTITDIREKDGRSGQLVFITYELTYRVDAQDKVRETYVRILR